MSGRCDAISLDFMDGMDKMDGTRAKARTTYGVLLVSLLLIRVGAVKDGLSDRGIIWGAASVDCVDGMDAVDRVGWWAWHVVGVVPRDLVQVALVWVLGAPLMARLRGGWTRLAGWIGWFALWAGVNFWLHQWWYWGAWYNRGWFGW